MLLALEMGCALFGPPPNIGQYAASTEVTYETDGQKKSGTFKSNKEYTDFEAEYDPATGKAHVKAGKAGTSESALAAMAKAQEAMAKLFESLAPMLKDLLSKGAAVGAGS